MRVIKISFSVAVIGALLTSRHRQYQSQTNDLALPCIVLLLRYMYLPRYGTVYTTGGIDYIEDTLD